MKFDLSIFRKSADSVAQHLGAVREEKANAQREHALVKNAPATREEVKAMVQAWAAGKAAHYAKRFAFNIGEFISNPQISLANPQAIEMRMTMFGKSRQLAALGMFPGPELQDEALCYLMGPAVVKALHAVIDEMPWPAGALPLAGRAEKLLALAKQIEELTREESELVAQARAALAI